MQRVDLTLAVNYLPACTCLGKLLVFMLAIALIPGNDESVRGGFLILAALLYMDRVITRNIIFDANAILMAVFFANVHAVIRTKGTMRTYPFLMAGLHICWANTCGLLIAEPLPVRRMFERRLTAAKIVPVVMMLVITVGTSYFQEDLEPSPLRACRALAFTLLAFAWIYVVGIHTQLGLEYLKENSAQFVARLAPVLYSPLWIAFLFCPGVVWGLVAQYIRLTQLQTYQPLPVVSSSMPASTASAASTSDTHTTITISQKQANSGEHPPLASSSNTSMESTSDLEALFRMAKQASNAANNNKARPHHLDPIQEVL